MKPEARFWRRASSSMRASGAETLQLSRVRALRARLESAASVSSALALRTLAATTGRARFQRATEANGSQSVPKAVPKEPKLPQDDGTSAIGNDSANGASETYL